jgi:hypothetical protein
MLVTGRSPVIKDYLQSPELSTLSSNVITDINGMKSHENYLGDEDTEVSKASTSEAINASVCPLILYFTNVNYKTAHYKTR